MTDLDLELVDLDNPYPPPDPEYAAYLKRVESNRRPFCGDCGAFITREQAAKVSWDGESDPLCPPGKGCRR